VGVKEAQVDESADDPHAAGQQEMERILAEPQRLPNLQGALPVTANHLLQLAQYLA
jgi:hypothetical protein